MKELLYLLITLLFLSSCSSRRYGHYRYSRKNTHKVAKANQKKRISTVTLNQNKPKQDFPEIGIKRTSIKVFLLKKSDEEETEPLNVESEITNESESLVMSNKFGLKDTVNRVLAKPNENAEVSMALGIVSLFFVLFSFFYLPLLFGAFVLGLGSLDFAKKALEEIEANPAKYSNKKAAIIGKIIGSIYKYIIILIAIILALAIMFGIIALLIYMIGVIA